MLIVYFVLLSQQLIHTIKSHMSYTMFLGVDLSSYQLPPTQLHTNWYLRSQDKFKSLNMINKISLPLDTNN